MDTSMDNVHEEEPCDTDAEEGTPSEDNEHEGLHQLGLSMNLKKLFIFKNALRYIQFMASNSGN